MKQLRNNAFKKLMNHLKELPFIEWENGENNSGFFSEEIVIKINDYNVCFYYVIELRDKLCGIAITNLEIEGKEGEQFSINPIQWGDLYTQVKSLFNLEIEEYEPESEHAFNIGE